MTFSFPDKKKKKKISSLFLIVLAFNCFYYQCTQVQATTTTTATATTTKEETTESSTDDLQPSLITLAPVVQTAEGKVQGIVQRWDAHSGLSSNDAHNSSSSSSSIVYLYQGIPYGRIPGGGRFEAAVPAEKWSGIYPATHYRDACPQLPSARMFGRILRLLSMTNSTSEADCLLLNVWRPVVAVTGDGQETGRKKPLPVMVFIHGGAFETGTIFTQAYDGRYLATVGGVVVVTLQYRLGALGFLTAPGQVPANLGLRDQVLALRWVRRNAAAFGGDPRAVTVFGESAGGSSVAALILSPLASNLFQRAVVQSAAQGGFFSSESVEQSLEKTMRLAARLGCHKQQPKFELGNVKQWLPEVVRCLKERPVEAILAASADAFATNGLFLPVYGADAEVLPQRPEDVLKEESDGGDGNHQGAHHQQQLPNPGDLDLMFGITKDEGSMFALALFPELALQDDKNLLTVNSTKALIVRLMQHYGRSAVEGAAVADFYADRLLKRRPNAQTSQDELKSTIGAVWGDLHLACPTLLFGQRYSLKQAARAKKAANSQRSRQAQLFAYQLNSPVTVPNLMNSMMPSWIGTFHTTDLFYLFMAPLLVRSASLGQAHYRLSLQMMTAWATFARTGAPGRVGFRASEQSVQWEEANLADNHSDDGISAMIFEAGSFHMQKDLLREVCQGFWRGKIDV